MCFARNTRHSSEESPLSPTRSPPPFTPSPLLSDNVLLSKLDPWWWAEAHTRPLWLISEERTHNQSSVRVFVLRHYDILIPLHTRGRAKCAQQTKLQKMQIYFPLKARIIYTPFSPPKSAHPHPSTLLLVLLCVCTVTYHHQALSLQCSSSRRRRRRERGKR